MGLYNVIQPCTVNGLHYVNRTEQPIQVDDEQAGKLVAAGKLEPYGVLDGIKRTERDLSGDFLKAGREMAEAVVEGLTATEVEADKNADEARRSRGRRKSDPEDAA